jgi:hypothetical protein
MQHDSAKYQIQELTGLNLRIPKLMLYNDRKGEREIGKREKERNGE